MTDALAALIREHRAHLRAELGYVPMTTRTVPSQSKMGARNGPATQERPGPGRNLRGGHDMAQSSDVAAFWAKVDKSGECWEWTARRQTHGYGQLLWDGKWRLAHRIAYEMANGPVPAGRELDHLCSNKACVRPDHLEAVTHRENILRASSGFASINAAKTHCPRGHEYTPENTMRFGPEDRWRWCRTCSRETNRARRARLKAQRSA